MMNGISALIRVMTCNVRYWNASDGDNAWDSRKALLAKVIGRYAPDLIGFQEMWVPQREYLAAELPAYAWFGITDKPRGENPMNSIAWRSERFELVSPGGYWLSQTPHVPGSRSWDSTQPRLANWVRLIDTQTGNELRLVNTHLDNRGETARPEQARLINEDAAAYDPQYPQILTGDMNARPASPAIDRFLQAGWRDTYQFAHGTFETGPTFHGFKGADCADKGKRIDWIFQCGAFTTHGAKVVRDQEKGRLPSDHYPLIADVTVQRSEQDE